MNVVFYYDETARVVRQSNMTEEGDVGSIVDYYSECDPRIYFFMSTDVEEDETISDLNDRVELLEAELVLLKRVLNSHLSKESSPSRPIPPAREVGVCGRLRIGDPERKTCVRQSRHLDLHLTDTGEEFMR